MRIPWCIPDYQPDDIILMKHTLDSGWLSMGSMVERFEHLLAGHLDIKHAVAVNNGTSALDTMLKTIGIKQYDEVIVPSLTYIATSNAVLYNHGTPVYADVDDTLNIDPEDVEKRITKDTRAIISIDYGGNPADHKTLRRIARKHGVMYLVDGAQSLGATYHDKPCPTQGCINTMSFHQAKPLTTVEGGMLFTNNKHYRDTMRCIRNQGQQGRYNHIMLGNNYRMTDITAAMGVSQTNRLKRTIRSRQLKAHYYREQLVDVDYPEQYGNTTQGCFLFLIKARNRDKLLKYLSWNRVETRTYTPISPRKNATVQASHIISLPLFNTITQEQQDYVIHKINSFQKSSH